MIGVIGALEAEVEAIKKRLNNIETKEIREFKFYLGNFENKNIVLLQSGVGKVSAAIATVLLLENFDIDLVINVGTAGGIDLALNQGDVVVASEVMYHDVNVTGFNYPLGQMAGQPVSFIPNEKLVKKLVNILKEQQINYHLAIVASGDQFISNETEVEKIKKVSDKIMAVEMEGAAIAHVCHQYQKSFVLTRSISDVVGKGENNLQFDEFINLASEKSAISCMSLISML